MNDALFRAGELADGSSDLDSVAVIYMNRAYRALYMGGSEFDPRINETWWWMKAEAQLILEAVIDPGTANVSNNSTTVVFSATPAPTIDSDVTGWYFKADNHPDVFKISSISSATGTLDSVYTGDTDSTAGYKLFKINYDIASAAIKIVAPMVAYQNNTPNIYGMALSRMDEEFPLGEILAGVPTRFGMVDENTVRFNRYGSSTDGEIVRLDYDYLARPSDLADNTTEPDLPLEYRHVLADMTCYFLLKDKGSTDAEFMGLQARNGIRAMAKENAVRWGQMGQPAQILPRLRRTHRRAVRTDGEGIIIG